MAEDHLGRMWIATFGGLICYDGYESKLYTHVPGDSTSIPHNRISDITCSGPHGILISGYGGLALMDTKSMHCTTLSKPGMFDRPDRN